jgi:hypothetical protein
LALPNIRDDEIGAVRQELLTDPTGQDYASADAAGKARLLVRKPLVPNPATAPQVPRPMDAGVLLGLVPPEQVRTISETGITAVSTHIDQGSYPGVARWVKIALAKGQIGQATHDAIMAKLAETIPDPNHPAQVLGQSRLQAVLGRDPGGVSAAEVDAILAGGE